MKELKPFLPQLIKFYYEDLGRLAGGSLHVALDDGNLDAEMIFHCQEFALKEGDSFGYFLATLMREFTEDELLEMYENGWRSK